MNPSQSKRINPMPQQRTYKVTCVYINTGVTWSTYQRFDSMLPVEQIATDLFSATYYEEIINGSTLILVPYNVIKVEPVRYTEVML